MKYRLDSTYPLQNGVLENVEMPYLGLGTARLKGETAMDAVNWAAEAGYRHIDTASYYYNEESIGKAIKQARVDREEFFIVSKINPREFEKGRAAFDATLDRLATDYLDLYLIHYPPQDTEAWLSIWHMMEELLDEGKCRAIGVSNFGVDELKLLEKRADIQPAVNQIRLYPFVYRRQKPIVDYCKSKHIFLIAYTPLAGNKFKHRLVVELSRKYDKTPAQIYLRWSLQHGFGIIPRSSKKEHIEENADIFDFEISHEDMAKMDLAK